MNSLSVNLKLTVERSTAFAVTDAVRGPKVIVVDIVGPKK